MCSCVSADGVDSPYIMFFAKLSALCTNVLQCSEYQCEKQCRQRRILSALPSALVLVPGASYHLCQSEKNV